MPAMEEVLPGVLHWTRVHDRIGIPVHSYFVADRGLLIDPMEPDEGLDALADHGNPERIVLSVRHHLRHSERFVTRFGCDIVAHEAGLHEFEDGPEVRGFAFGDEIAPGVRALELAAICPEDTVLHIRAGLGALHFGDGIIRRRGRIGFVPDGLMDEPETVKRRTFERLRELLDEDFDALLFAHGDPLAPTGGRDALAQFVAAHT
jgi:hypothetical protein